MHYEGECDELTVIGAIQNKVAKRQKGDECHIVCDEHRAEKCYVNKGENGGACGFKNADDTSRDNAEKPNIFVKNEIIISQSFPG